MTFLEEEAQEDICSEDELELRYKNDPSWDNLDWDDELAGFLDQEQDSAKRKYTRQDRIDECGKISHSLGVDGGHVVAIYRCGCLECPHCFESAKEKETMRLRSAMYDGPLYLTIIPSHKGSAAKKHIQRHGGLYRRYPSASGRDTYVIDEAAKKALANHSRMRLKFQQLKQPSLKWKRVLKYVVGKKRSGSLGKARISKKDEGPKVRLIFPRATVNDITAQQKRSAWRIALEQTPDAPEPNVEAIQEACEIRFAKWIEQCELVGATVKDFGVRVRLVPESQLNIWIGCDIGPFELYMSLPDYFDGVAVGTREPELVFA